MSVFLRLTDVIVAVLVRYGMCVRRAVVGVGDQVGMDVAVASRQSVRDYK